MIVNELWEKPLDYKFSLREISLILKHIKEKRYKAVYAIYNKKSSKGLYVTFMIDYIPNSTRRSGLENYWTRICERDLNEDEIFECAQNWGTQRNRFKVWYYKNVEQLIQEDLKYGIETPQKFINECKKLGYGIF